MRNARFNYGDTREKKCTMRPAGLQGQVFEEKQEAVPVTGIVSWLFAGEWFCFEIYGVDSFGLSRVVGA